ncbi:MAG: MmgE/PrpD family protein [Gammaproteobacteria bacterium]
MSTPTQSADARLSARLAGFVAGLAPGQVPQPVLEHAKRCLLDSIGIALAAGTYDHARPGLAAAAALGGSGDSPVIGQAAGLPLRDAAMANGTLIHSLDFDDTHSGSVVHCSASAWPVALNLGLESGASGLDALTAFVIAVETDARVGEIAQGELQRRGFHPTGIVGAFGCAAASAWLKRLDRARHEHALGIVWSLAAGSMEWLSDGAWTKRLHPGWAAVCGITAAAYAEHGFVGTGAPLEGRFGLFNTLLGAGGAEAASGLGRDLGEAWRTPEIAFKPYPACHFNHAYIEAAVELRRAHTFEPADVRRIIAEVHPDQAAVVCEPLAAKRAPASAYEAQFSVPYVIAAALERGRFTLAELEPDALADRAILELAARVDHRPDPDSAYPRYYSGGVAIELADGRRLHHHVDVNRGADARPLDEAALREKFHDNATRAIDSAAAERIAEVVACLDTAPDLGELAAAIRPPARASLGLAS